MTGTYIATWSNPTKNQAYYSHLSASSMRVEIGRPLVDSRNIAISLMDVRCLISQLLALVGNRQVLVELIIKCPMIADPA